MPDLISQPVQCPYCGELFEALIDTSNSDYIEDCYVCCRPIIFTIHQNEGLVEIQLSTEDD